MFAVAASVAAATTRKRQHSSASGACVRFKCRRFVRGALQILLHAAGNVFFVFWCACVCSSVAVGIFLREYTRVSLSRPIRAGRKLHQVIVGRVHARSINPVLFVTTMGLVAGFA